MHFYYDIIKRTLKKLNLLLVENCYGVLGFKICLRNYLYFLYIVFCAKAMIQYHKKWKWSFYIISHLVINIPTFSHYSRTKKAYILTIPKHNNKHPGKIP